MCVHFMVGTRALQNNLLQAVRIIKINVITVRSMNRLLCSILTMRQANRWWQSGLNKTLFWAIEIVSAARAHILNYRPDLFDYINKRRCWNVQLIDLPTSFYIFGLSAPVGSQRKHFSSTRCIFSRQVSLAIQNPSAACDSLARAPISRWRIYVWQAVDVVLHWRVIVKPRVPTYVRQPAIHRRMQDTQTTAT